MHNKPASIVVIIHGIWMPAVVMWPLAIQLKRHGQSPVLFGYPTLASTLTDSALRLNRFIETLDAEHVHLVAHSLGGLLVRAMFHLYPDQPPGRIVMLGTPADGSVVAERLRCWGPLGRSLVGRSLGQYLDEGQSWSMISRDLGVIAGSRAFGMGSLAGGLSGPGDGTVLIKETRCRDMTDHIVLPLTHSALVAAPSVARQVVHFLEYGKFYVSTAGQPL
ncbi:MAG: alpha/beta hydrolase [Gammaproteobacteria bacterium]|nr:alpha/beta hydrolase [Gammaproteobacteria bacterium]